MGLRTSKIRCGNIAVPHYYLHPYLPLEAGKDPISQSLIKFKQRIQPDLDTWIASALETLVTLPFSADTMILRALRHDETTPRTDFPAALDILGQSLADHLRCRYVPTLLAKTRTTLPNKYLTRDQRRSQLADVYFIIEGDRLSPDTPFLLIDDILTTGTTMRAIIRTLRTAFPACPIKVFTLTRADYQTIRAANTV